MTLKPKNCNICDGEISKSLPKFTSVHIKELTGKELHEVLKNLCGSLQISQLDKYIFCQDCMLKLVQTDSFLVKVRKAFCSETQDTTELTTCLTSSHVLKCDLCDIQFKQAKAFKNHLSVKHNITDKKIYKCHTCPQVFEARGSLLRHITWTHTNRSREYSCPVCKKLFFYEKVLIQHISRHNQNSTENGPTTNGDKSTEKPMAEKMEVDDNDGDNRSALAATQEQFACSLCEYLGKSAKKLQKHKMQEHADNNGDDNDASYTNDTITTTTGKKRRLCSDSSDGNEKNDNELNNSKHARRFECGTCDFNTSVLKKFMKHKKQHAPEMSAINTNSTPKLSHKTKKHEKSMEFRNISKIYGGDNKMGLSSNSDDQRNNVCLICGKSFTDDAGLRSHMSKSHMNEQTILCTHCGIKFESAEELEEHIFSDECRTTKHYCPVSVCNRHFESEHKLSKHIAKAHKQDSNE